MNLIQSWIENNIGNKTDIINYKITQ